MKKAIIAALLLFLLKPGILKAQAHHPKKHTKKLKKPGIVQTGTASFYANKFTGRKTYTGEIFSQEKMTGASNTLAMGTWVRITNLRNKKTAIVRINDKMHPLNKRLIDLSHAAAKKLGYTGHGLAHVKIEVLGKEKPLEVVAEETSAVKPH
jgi:rare lipoprotein A